MGIGPNNDLVLNRWQAITWNNDNQTWWQYMYMASLESVLKQIGRHFADHTFDHIFFNENIRVSIKISLKSIPKFPINNISALVQITAWRRSGDKPLSERTVVNLLTHKYVTRPQWVKNSESTDTLYN